MTSPHPGAGPVAGPEPGLGVARAGLSTGTWPGQGADFEVFGRSGRNPCRVRAGSSLGGYSPMGPTRWVSTTGHQRQVYHDRSKPLAAWTVAVNGPMAETLRMLSGGRPPAFRPLPSQACSAAPCPSLIGGSMSRRPLPTTTPPSSATSPQLSRTSRNPLETRHNLLDLAQSLGTLRPEPQGSSPSWDASTAAANGCGP
jgi:hypothetical protein